MDPKQVQWLLEKALWAGNVLASAVVVWRLLSLQVQREYRFFLIFLVLAISRSAALLIAVQLGHGPRSNEYLQIWSFTQPMLWVSYVLVVYELYGLVLKHYEGIKSVGRWFFFTAVATSAIVAAATVLPVTSGAYAKTHPVLLHYALVERSIFTSLAIFLLLLLALIAWFPVPISRNLLTHSCIYSTYFFVTNVILLWWHLEGKQAAQLADYAKFAVWIGCCACWIFLLSRAGENRTASLRWGRDVEKERRLLQQLEGLNATLLRTARK